MRTGIFVRGILGILYILDDLIVKYLRKLIESIFDDRNVFVEFLLAWIAVALTALVIFTVLYYIS